MPYGATIRVFSAVFIGCILLFTSSFSQSVDQIFDKEIERLKKQDSLEAFAYAYLDEFLKEPAYDRLFLFTEMENKQWREPVTHAEHLGLVILHSNEGFYNLRHSRVEKAIIAYEKAWEYYQAYNFKDYDIIEYCLKPLGNAYSMLGDYTSAENIIKSYLLKAGALNNEAHQVSALINLSIVYHDTGRNREAIDVLNNAIDFGPVATNKAGHIYSGLAKSYLQLEAWRKAMSAALSALEFFQNNDQNEGELTNIHATLSLIHIQQSDTTRALEAMQVAVELANKSQNIAPRQRAKINAQYANLLGAAGRSDAALTSFGHALASLIPDYNHKENLPGLQALFAENTFKEIFDGMATIYSRAGFPKQAIACYERSFMVEELLKDTYNYDEAKYLQQNENRQRAEQVIGLLYTLYKKENESQYIRKAFEVAELTKSIALKDELYNRQAWQKYGSDSLVSKRMALAQEKSAIEYALILEQQKGDKANITAIQKLIDRKNQITLRLKSLKTAMNFSGFRRLDVDTLQNKIANNRLTMIEYFFGTKACYTFILDGSQIRLKVNKNIDSLRKVVTQYSQLFTDEVKINAAPELFAGIAERLHNLLIPKELDSTLLIIPDGLLNFIPFESLLTAAPSSTDYAQWPWRIKEGPIFYQYSAALYASSDYRPNAFQSDEVLGFFPQFEQTRRYLKYSKDEREAIQRYFEGSFINNEAATKEAFLSKANNYPIIHLSTHATAGGLHEPPSIFFYDSALYLPEIYGLNLQTDLLVLGACETGIGKLYRGEGPISLAGGFSYAGVKNIMLSLWKVNDYSTSRLMAHFYNNYRDRHQAYLALHQAKLDYLHDDEIAFDKKSPYYWASFVYYGHEQKPAENTYYKAILYITGLLLTGMVLGVIYYRFSGTKKSKSNFL